MGQPYDIEIGPQHVVLSNVASDGTVAIPANNTPVLVATVPLSTGPVPLDATTLYALVLMTFGAVTANGAQSLQRGEWAKLARAHGNPTPASVSIAGPSDAFNDDVGLVWDTASLSLYCDITSAINGSGDMEVSITGKSSGAQALTFYGLRFKYRVLGSK